ncbi:MAG TPA: phosphodiester glycosidase family protein [Niabella sp.]
MKTTIMTLLLAVSIMPACKKTFVSDPPQQLSLSDRLPAQKLAGVVAANDSAFNIVAYAGSGTAGTSNGTSGNPQTAQFNTPEGIAFDSHGNLFVADRNNAVIRKITPAGIVSVFAGTPGTAGYANGTGTAAKFDYPIRLAIDGADNIYVADRNNARIRKITPSAVVTTIAGSTAGSGAAQFNWPLDVAVTGDGTKIYVADAHNNRIQQIIYSGGTYTTSVLAGQTTAGFSGGNGTAAKFNNPSGLAIDLDGNVIVADRGNNCIRKITTAKNVYRLAGIAGTYYDVDAPNGEATFGEPYGITVTNDGCIYVADIGYHNIRRISNHGLFVSTVAGSGSVGNATGNYSSFNLPTSIAVDNSGNFYVADCANHNIRKMIPETRVLQITHGWSQTTPYPGITRYQYHGNRFWLPSAFAAGSTPYNKKQGINVLDIDLSVNHLDFRESDLTLGARKKLTDIIGADLSVLAASTGVFATYETDPTPPRSHAAYLRINGTTLWNSDLPGSDKYWPYHSGMFFVNNDGTVGIERSDLTQVPFNPVTTNRKDMMSGAPLLIENSVPVEITSPGAPWQPTPQKLRIIIAARTAIALPVVNNHVLLICVDGIERKEDGTILNDGSCYVPPVSYYGMTTADLTQFIQQFFHARAALNFDGGGTSAMAMRGYGDNGSHTGYLGIINYPDYDSPCSGLTDKTAYGQQRTVGEAIAVVAN